MKNVSVLLMAVLLCLAAVPALAYDGTIWLGNADGSPLIFRTGSIDTIPIFVQANEDVYIAAVHIPVATSDKYIVERRGGRLFQPFVGGHPPAGYEKGWDDAEILKPVKDKQHKGYTNQSILGFASLDRKPNLPLHCSTPCRVAEFYVRTAGNDSLRGHTYAAIIEGYQFPSKGLHLSDTLGVRTFKFKVICSPVYFLYRGDVNSDFKIDQADLAALSLFLRGKGKLACPRQQADCNGDGQVNKEDRQYLENYLAGKVELPR